MGTVESTQDDETDEDQENEEKPPSSISNSSITRLSEASGPKIDGRKTSRKYEFTLPHDFVDTTSVDTSKSDKKKKKKKKKKTKKGKERLEKEQQKPAGRVGPRSDREIFEMFD